MNEWLGRRPSRPVALALRSSGVVVATASRDGDGTTELNERMLRLPTPQIRHLCPWGADPFHYVLLQAPTHLNYADLLLDSGVELWTEGALTLPCACTRPDYDWVNDIGPLSPYPDWLHAAVRDVIEREAGVRAAWASKDPHAA